MSELSTRIDTCAGGVVYRQGSDGTEIAVAIERDRLSGARNVRLAKGHVDPGESVEAAALREVREEFGLPGEIVAPLGSVHYTFREQRVAIDKTVHFFLMRLASEETHPLDGEMRRIYWSPIAAAARDLTFDTERCIVERAREWIAAEGSR